MNPTSEGFLDVVDHLECRLFAFVVKMILNEEATDCHTHPVVGVYDALLPSRLVTCYSLRNTPYKHTDTFGSVQPDRGNIAQNL